MNTYIALVNLPFFPSEYAHSVYGQFLWYFAGWAYGIMICLAGQVVTYLRAIGKQSIV